MARESVSAQASGGNERLAWRKTGMKPRGNGSAGAERKSPKGRVEWSRRGRIRFVNRLQRTRGEKVAAVHLDDYFQGFSIMNYQEMEQ